MRRECRECFPRHWLQRKPPVSDPGMHHGTCATPWCVSGSLTRGGGENVPGIPGACVTYNFTHLARGPWVLQRQEMAKINWQPGHKTHCKTCALLWISLSTLRSMMCANDQVYRDLKMKSVCLHIPLFHYQHYADRSEIIEHMKYLSDIFCWVCL